MKKNLLFLFYFMSGGVIGAVIAGLCANIPALSWLAYSQAIGFSPNTPAVLDLSIIKFAFGFSMNISVAQIITIIIALYVYTRSRIR